MLYNSNRWNNYNLCGDFKIHTFTGPGTFCVSAAGSNTCAANNINSYLVIAGGGGGLVVDTVVVVEQVDLENLNHPTSYTASPLDGKSFNNHLELQQQVFQLQLVVVELVVKPGTPPVGNKVEMVFLQHFQQ